jgi:hypothetical protein
MRRYRRSPERVRQLVEQVGLLLEEERGAGTAEHWILLRRALG